MIESLRKKFILASMVSIFLVLTMILSAICLLNYNRISENADSLIQIIYNNGGIMPKVKLSDDKPPDELPRKNIGNMSPETPYESRYFSVDIKNTGEISDVNTGMVAAIDSTTAVKYAQEVYSMKKEKGFYGNYRFLCIDNGDTKNIVFLDCRRDLDSLISFMMNGIFVSLIGMTAVFVLILIISKRVFKPVEESYRKQKEFITNAGHEIKTPLTIIDANTDIIEIENGESEWTDGIKNQVTRLSNLTNDLISLSRMEECRDFNMKEFSISEMIEKEVESFRPAMSKRNLEIKKNITSDITYIGDEKYLRQLITILMDNAVKYADENGYIEVSLKKLHGRRKVEIVLYNTSDKIDKESIDQIFERFFRGDKSRNSDCRGYGIGLSIAKAIVSAHKGKIKAESQDGKSISIKVNI